MDSSCQNVAIGPNGFHSQFQFSSSNTDETFSYFYTSMTESYENDVHVTVCFTTVFRGWLQWLHSNKSFVVQTVKFCPVRTTLAQPGL